MKIAIAGTGYVGMSMATLLSQRHQVVAVDVVPEKVEMINRRQSPIQDEYIERYLAQKDLDLVATLPQVWGRSGTLHMEEYAGADTGHVYYFEDR